MSTTAAIRPFPRVEYDRYALQQDTSSEVVTHLLADLVHPASVLDVGCGRGVWLRGFEACGAADLAGVDGAWVRPDDFACPTARLVAHDLNSPLDLGRTFDLVVSVEVAEHMRPESADTFVDTLARHGKVIAFSAAIPGQEGTDHLNEQWPAYWTEKFRARGYTPIDCLRPALWEHPGVLWWYAQNLLLMVHDEALPRFAHLPGVGSAPPLVHPRLFRYKTLKADVSGWPAGALARALALRLVRPLRRRAVTGSPGAGSST